MRTITAADLTCVNPQRFEFAVAASDLNIPPGRCPDVLSVAGDVGNGMPLIRTGYRAPNGQLESIMYRQEFGCITVAVLND